MRLIGVAAALSIVLSGCMQNAATRTALTPSSYAATGAGAASAESGIEVGISGGGLVGGSIGNDFSQREKRMALEAEYRALESTPAGEPVSWRDTASGRTGTVRAAQPYRVGSQDCRQYTHEVQLGGGSQQARGTACRNEDGSWTLLS